MLMLSNRKTGRIYATGFFMKHKIISFYFSSRQAQILASLKTATHWNHPALTALPDDIVTSYYLKPLTFQYISTMKTKALYTLALAVFIQPCEAQYSVRFRLYPTENIWSFIKLDTRTGICKRVQFSTKGNDYRFEEYINYSSVDLLVDNSIDGRYALYPTQNMYNFIMLDQISGKTWQVQWHTDPDNSAVIPINTTE